MANQGRLERPITSSRLLELLKELVTNSLGSSPPKSSLSSNQKNQAALNLEEKEITSTASKENFVSGKEK